MTAVTPLKLYNLARMTVSTTGTGSPLTLVSAVPGYLNFSTAGVQDQDEICYGIFDPATNQSEVGSGIYTASGTTLTRTQIDASTNSGTAINLSGSAQIFILARAQDVVPEAKWNGGRITFTSGAPVLTANTTAQSTVLWSPWAHDHLALPDANGNWTTYHVAEGTVSVGVASGLAISLDTTNFLSGNNYDIFGFVLNGVPRLGYGPAWTSASSRNANISRAGGVWTNTATITLRMDATHTQSVGANNARCLASIRATANGQSGMNFTPTAASGGTGNILGLFNFDNRVLVVARCLDSVASYTYNTTTWRASNNNTNNSISYIDGLGEMHVLAIAKKEGTFTANSGAAIAAGINLNSTSATPANTVGNFSGVAQTIGWCLTVDGDILPALGYNTLTHVEWASSTATTTITSNESQNDRANSLAFYGMM